MNSLAEKNRIETARQSASDVKKTTASLNAYDPTYDPLIAATPRPWG